MRPCRVPALCNAHFRELAEYAKKGVFEATGFPLEFPVMSLGETKPATDRHDVPEPGFDGCRGIQFLP
jgi:hypothetical protein